MEYYQLIEYLKNNHYWEFLQGYIFDLIEIAKDIEIDEDSSIFTSPQGCVYLSSDELTEYWSQFFIDFVDSLETVDFEFNEDDLRCIMFQMLEQECSRLISCDSKCYSKSIFYPIGQGLMNVSFITNCTLSADFSIEDGSATLEKEDFFSVHVYDCGSGKTSDIPASKQNVLDDFFLTLKKYSKDMCIDYLYISHFDSDHVNGIGNLLKNCTCKNIVIAYTPFPAIVSDIYTMISETEENNETLKEEMRYQSIFPIESLLEMVSSQNNDVNIILLNNHTNLQENIIFENFSSEAAASIGSLSHKLMIDSQNSYHIVNNSNTVYIYYTYPKINNSDFVSNIYIEDYDWNYLISYYVPPNNTIEEISKDFINLLHNTWQDIPLYYKDGRWKIAVLKHLRNAQDRKIFKQIYKKFCSDINTLSLCLSIAPKETIKLDTEELSAQNYLNDELGIYENTIYQSGTLLLTGDAVLDENFSGEITYYDSIINALNANNFPPIQTILLPHHGSDKNINNETFNALSQTAKQWVVSYGKNNSYVHPCAPPCTWIGTHICVQCNIHPKKNTFPEEASEEIKDIIIPKPDTAAEDIIEPINDITLYHCHDSSKVTVFIYYKPYQKTFFD